MSRAASKGTPTTRRPNPRAWRPARRAFHAWGGSPPSCPVALALIAFAALLALFPSAARAQINPWIANSVYNPQEWDSAGPDTATPWLHPPADYKTDQGWGILPPASALEDDRWHHLSNLTGS